MPSPLLSICIPTYNRANLLEVCLESISALPAEERRCIEIFVSDNASTDHTRDVVKRFQEKLPIQYFRSAENVGAERNILAVARHVTTEYVWVFGDDDEFCANALSEVLPLLKKGFDLLVLNYSSWTKDMRQVLKKAGLRWTSASVCENPNQVLSTYGVHLGYISGIVARKDVFLKASGPEWEKYVEYGFPHMYSMYRGLISGCRVAYVPAPIFRRREFNCAVFMGEGARNRWIKYFIEGTALIFEDLGRHGYDPGSVQAAKNQMLTDFGVGILIPDIATVDKKKLLSLLTKHYLKSSRFWTNWLPTLLLPRSVSRKIYSIYKALQKRSRATS